jgi:oxaloacetate decarboxylase (Na+ extruding) subunit alpha
MPSVEILDSTLRDGQQSLWGMRMQAGMALPVADILDRTGFSVIDVAGSSHMEVLLKYKQEDPWEGLDLVRGAIHRTPIRGGMRANACISFGVSPDALMDLWMRRLNEHGIRSYWIYDVLYGIENFARLARVAKEYGSQVVGTVFYTISPVHTDEYLAAKAAEIAAVP